MSPILDLDFISLFCVSQEGAALFAHDNTPVFVH